MAYLQNGFIVIRAGSRELVIEEFDEDAVSIEASEDKGTRRSTTRGRNVFSIKDKVPYELEMNIPPVANQISRVLDFLKYLRNNRYTEFEFETHETIDGKSLVTYYEDGNILTDLDSEEIFSTDAPTNILKIAGTRVNKEI